MVDSIRKKGKRKQESIIEKREVYETKTKEKCKEMRSREAAKRNAFGARKKEVRGLR